MASIKHLKKDIDYVVSELVVDCLNYVNFHMKADKDAAFKIIEDALKLRNEARDLANNPDGKHNPALVKAHYKNAVDKLIAGVEEGYSKLGKLTEV